MVAHAHAPKRETITRKEATPNGIPWQWGYDAARDGYPATCCPWTTGTPSALKWHEGHAEGLKGPAV